MHVLCNSAGGCNILKKPYLQKSVIADLQFTIRKRELPRIDKTLSSLPQELVY